MAEDKSAQVPKRVQLITDATLSVLGIDMRVVPERKEVLLVTASNDEKVRLYSAALNQSIHFQLRSYVLHNFTSCACVAHFDQTGTLLLSADNGGTLIVSDVRNMSHPVQITVFDHPNVVVAACWSSSGNTIISACEDNTIRTFDISKKSSPCKKYKVPSKGTVCSMVCSGHTIVVADGKGWLFRFAIQDPSHVISQIHVHDGRIAWYDGVDVLDDGICVSAGTLDRSVCICDMNSNKKQKIKHSNLVSAVHVPVKGADMVFSACYDGYVRLHDLKCSPTRELFKLKTANSPACITSCALPGQQGGLLAVGCYFSGACEVYRWLSLPVDKVCMYGVYVQMVYSVQMSD